MLLMLSYDLISLDRASNASAVFVRFCLPTKPYIAINIFFLFIKLAPFWNLFLNTFPVPLTQYFKTQTILAYEDV